MFTYQARPRVFRSRSGGNPTFPCKAEVSFYLQPLQSFGMAAGGGLTAVRGVPVTVHFDANTGQHSAESLNPLAPLHAHVDTPFVMTVEGNRLTVTVTCESWNSLQGVIQTVYFGLPLLLSVELADPSRVERVDGVAAGVPFTWELSPWSMPVDVTTQEDQTERVTRACGLLRLLMKGGNARLVGALHYFHIACRLRREAKTPGEFLGESLLNLNRVLEILYGPKRDDVRAALIRLGFGTEEVERDFIPVMLLRNAMDVGHPSLAMLTDEQLRTLHRYADHAEHRFRRLIQRLLKSLASGETEIPPYEDIGPDKDLLHTIANLQERLGSQLL